MRVLVISGSSASICAASSISRPSFMSGSSRATGSAAPRGGTAASSPPRPSRGARPGPRQSHPVPPARSHERGSRRCRRFDNDVVQAFGARPARPSRSPASHWCAWRASRATSSAPMRRAPRRPPTNRALLLLPPPPACPARSRPGSRRATRPPQARRCNASLHLQARRGSVTMPRRRALETALPCRHRRSCQEPARLCVGHRLYAPRRHCSHSIHPYSASTTTALPSSADAGKLVAHDLAAAVPDVHQVRCAHTLVDAHVEKLARRPAAPRHRRRSTPPSAPGRPSSSSRPADRRADPAVHEDVDAVHEAGLVRQEERDDGGDLV